MTDINKSFKSVDEEFRTYCYPDGSVITIHEVEAIKVRSSGYHMVNCKSGMKHLIKPGWNHIIIDTEEWDF